MEQTGHADLDALLAEFAARSEVRVLRRPDNAAGRCEQVASSLVDLLRGRGFSTPGREAYLSGDEWVGGVMVRDRSDADHFGYQDRPRQGHPTHVLCLVDIAGQTYSVDFTASQYGYSEFPLVQRLVPAATQAEERWERSWS